MDSLTTACARLLAQGNVLDALGLVALRNDPPALALRGIAMARLGDYARSRDLLRQAARGFGVHEPVERARCVVAQAEVALAVRDLNYPLHVLPGALATLESHNDHTNALQARLIMARCCLLLGRIDAATAHAARLETSGGPASLVAMAQLLSTELALRSLQIERARTALRQAETAAAQADIPALRSEVRSMQEVFSRPAARLPDCQGARALLLEEVAGLYSSSNLIIDGCRRGVSTDGRWLPLATRPVLYEIIWLLGNAWPNDISRETIIFQVFRLTQPDESHRARLRVQIGRLRKLIKPIARISATDEGYRLEPLQQRNVVVLAPPLDSEAASLMALLADGSAWSTSALAQALGASQRTVQRTLADLELAGQVNAVGHSRSRRWVCPSLAGFTTILLLPSVLPLK
ncbi:hypothetical protein W822_07250 [Advenella kashmirensis W13003]|uniref:DprA winged helix domain-containing protein n=1 Tax=Advenella kashmirensis W13003 TaxID=1424334 RepID=V8QUG3_9BURK|nr:HTH domain-containing protein [Advenella kashmirensis]ETF02644.1 hypothetical protein W822_07250 [Advenella kashmirensis W13003]